VEATEFRDRIPQFSELGVAIYGLSPDDLNSHYQFAEKHQLNFPLLADVGRKVIEQWGLYGEKERDGKKFMGVFRTTILVGPNGRVERLWENVNFRDHADAVLAAVRQVKGDA
jgi:peroxiredoxin Q/BCP